MMNSFEDILRATLVPAVREAVRLEVREALAAMQPASAGDYLSVKEAATLAGVSPDSIRSWIQTGKLPRHNAGRVLRVRRDELEQFLAGPPTDPTTPAVQLSPDDAAEAFLSRRRNR